MRLEQWQEGAPAGSFVQHIGTPFDCIIRRRWPGPAASGARDGRAPRVQVRIASSQADLALADEFVTERYLWRGYRVVGEEDGGGTSPLSNNDSATLLACRDGIPVGTITVGIDGDAGLLLDDGNSGTVDMLRRVGRRVGEFVRLAVRDDVDPGRVLYHLFRSAYELLRMVHKATDILIEVNPRHVTFYQKVFGFAVLGGERICPRVNAPGIVLRLDLVELDAQVGMAMEREAELADGGLQEVALAA